MAIFIEGLKEAIQQAACTGAQAGGWLAGKFAVNGIPVEGIQEAIDNYRVSNCGQDPNNLPPVSGGPPFTGGQCQGVLYTVDYTGGLGYVEPRDFRTFDGSISVTGPIEKLEWIQSGNTLTLTLFFDGQTQSLGGRADSNPAPIRTSQIENIVRVSGLPDDCGDPPAPYPDPVDENTETLPPVEWEGEDGNPFSLPNLPITFFRPCINLDGIRIPFQVDLPWGRICGKIGLRPDFGNILEPDIDIDVCPEQKTDYGIEERDVSEFFTLGEWEGSAPGFVSSWAGQRAITFNPEGPPILGVYIEAASISDLDEATNIFPQNTAHPNILIPYVAQVSFEHITARASETASGEPSVSYESSFGENIRVKQNAAFVPCRWQFGAASVQVEWARGWTGRYRLAYRKSCCSACEANDPNEGLDNLDRCRID